MAFFLAKLLLLIAVKPLELDILRPVFKTNTLPGTGRYTRVTYSFSKEEAACRHLYILRATSCLLKSLRFQEYVLITPGCKQSGIRKSGLKRLTKK